MATAKQGIVVKKAPISGAPHTQAVRYGSLVFVTGQGPLDLRRARQIRAARAAGKIPDSITNLTFVQQATLTLRNLGKVLRAAGSSLDSMLKVTVYLRDLAYFEEFNRIYRRFFRGNGPLPARSTVQVARLPFDILLMVDAIAHTRDGRP
ncbi:MAG: hypothetical protein HYV08_01345 [Deltaproteobacteria bacterium]|nr:hypothetical protein [Deltaproteobacteria bacterium]MBI3077158.1 hypothetical protein [Deltaproteobacteria bacterium]